MWSKHMTESRASSNSYYSMISDVPWSITSSMMPPSRSPSQEKLAADKASLREENYKWNDVQSKYITSRKAAELQAKMAAALKDLNESSHKKDVETADQMDLLREFVSMDEQVDIGKLVQKNKAKVDEILSAYNNISQSRITLLRELKHWFDNANERDDELSESGQDQMDIQSEQEQVPDATRLGFEDFFTQFKYSSDKLHSMREHILEVGTIMDHLKNNDVVPVNVLRSSIFNVESILSRMNKDMEEAVKRYSEAETRVKVLEEMLEEEHSKEVRKKNKRRHAAISEQKEREYIANLKKMKIDMEKANVGLLNERFDKKNYAQYASQLKYEIEKRDKFIEENTGKVFEISRKFSDLEDEIEQLKSDCEALRRQRDIQKVVLDRKIEEIQELKRENVQKEFEIIQTHVNDIKEETFTFTVHQTTQTDEVPEPTRNDKELRSSQSLKIVSGEDSSFVSGDLSNQSEGYWLNRLNAITELLLPDPLSVIDIRIALSIINELKEQAIKDMMSRSKQPKADPARGNEILEMENMNLQKQIVKYHKTIEKLTDRLSEEEEASSQKIKKLKTSVKTLEKEDKRSKEEIAKLRSELEKSRKPQVVKTKEVPQENKKVMKKKVETVPVAKVAKKDPETNTRATSPLKEILGRRSSPIASFGWESDTEYPMDILEFSKTSRKPKRDEEKKVDFSRGVAVGVQCKILEASDPPIRRLTSDSHIQTEPWIPETQCEFYKDLEKRARKYVEQDYKHQIKNLMSDIQAYKMGHAFFHNKIESHLMEITREYSLPIAKLDEEDENDLQYQFEENYLSKLNDSSSFPRSELVLDSAQRLKVLVKTMKLFIDDIFDSKSGQLQENNISQKMYKLRSSHERLLAEHAVLKSQPESRNVSQQGERKMLNISPVDIAKRTAEQLINSNKLLKETKAGLSFRKIMERNKLAQLQAEIYSLKQEGAHPRLINFMHKREKKQKEVLSEFELKRRAVQRQISTNIEKALSALNYIIYNPTENDEDNSDHIARKRSSLALDLRISPRTSIPNLFITSFNKQQHQTVTTTHKMTFADGSMTARKNLGNPYLNYKLDASYKTRSSKPQKSDLLTFPKLQHK